MSIHLITGKKGEPHVTSQNQGIINAMLFGDGKYVFDFGYNFETYVYNNTITIKDGQGLINGRHFEIEKNTTEVVTIDNGEVGSSRYDLIVARYSKNNQGFESISLEVVKGESVRLPSVPTEPTISDASILDGAVLVDFPLYRVEVVGVSDLNVTAKFTPMAVNVSATVEEIAELSDEVQDLIDSQVVDKDYVPTLFSGASVPPSSPSSLSPDVEPKYGDLYIKHYYNDDFQLYVLTEIGRTAGEIVFLGWEEIPLASALANKLDRNVGIKAFFGSSEPSPARANYSGLMSGDIYFEGTTSRVGGSIRKVYVAHISDNNEDLVFWRELTTNLSDIWNSYYSKSDTNSLLDDKLDREDGIKIFYGTTEPTQSLLNGSKTGDIYLRLNGNDRDVSQIIGMWIVSVYPTSGAYYWQKIPLGDYYTKTETDNLLSGKQNAMTLGGNLLSWNGDQLVLYGNVIANDSSLLSSLPYIATFRQRLLENYGNTNLQAKLTAGTNITIDANNVISATGGGGGTVDTAMSDSSTNAVQNRVIKSYIDSGLGTKQSTTAITTNTTDTDITLTVADNTEYRYTQELDSIDLTMPNGNFIASIVFESGSTATLMTYDSGIKWSGDDVVMGFFVPTADKTYNIVFWYDGINVNGIARGV